MPVTKHITSFTDAEFGAPALRRGVFDGLPRFVLCAANCSDQRGDQVSETLCHPSGGRNSLASLSNPSLLTVRI